MKIFELTTGIIRESFTDISVAKLGIDNIVKTADNALEDPAAYAITSFVGVETGAKDRGEWGGIMQSRRLEDAYSNNPSEEGVKVNYRAPKESAVFWREDYKKSAYQSICAC